jgi:DNA-binding MarR family transcriptional regulator
MATQAGTQRDLVADMTTVMDSMRAIVRALRISTRAVEKQIGISGAQLFVLQQLEQASARSVNELADRTSTHQSSVSTVVSRLVERGLVKRAASAVDGRRMEISITDRGRKLVASAPRTVQMRMQDAMRRMPQEQVHALAEAIGQLVRAGGFADTPPPMFFEDDASADV